MSRFDQPEDVTHADDRPDDEDTYREGDIMPDDLTGLTSEQRAEYAAFAKLADERGWKPLPTQEEIRFGRAGALALARGAQLDRIAAILRRFHGAEISASSVQPILDLALEMNPDLTDPRRI